MIHGRLYTSRADRAMTIPDEKLTAAIKAIKKESRTGKLLLNFSQGTATGGAQWIEKVPKGSKILALD